jgi:hypothetical protein
MYNALRCHGTPPARQVRVSNVKYVLDRVNRRDGYSMKKAVSFVREFLYKTRVKRKRRSSSITRSKLVLGTLL